MDKTILHMLAPTGNYMMGIVITTKNNNLIVIDGGRVCDTQRLKDYIAGRHISAWILTHPHDDHIGVFVSEFQRNGGKDFDIESVYCNFPPYEDINIKDVPDYGYRCNEFNEMIPAFNEIRPLFEDKIRTPFKGDSVTIDECRIDFLYSYHKELVTNPINDSSIVFRVTTPQKRVLFLGDLGPEGGDMLFRESREELKADIVQMSHHGHMNVSMEVYAEIMPEVCLWSSTAELYDEAIIPHYLSDTEKLCRMGRVRMYGAGLTRRWMDMLGVKTHYSTKYGDQTLEI